MIWRWERTLSFQTLVAIKRTAPLSPTTIDAYQTGRTRVLEQGDAVGESVMLMHQMVGLGRLLVALSFLFVGDLSDCNLLAGVALTLVGE